MTPDPATRAREIVRRCDHLRVHRDEFSDGHEHGCWSTEGGRRTGQCQESEHPDHWARPGACEPCIAAALAERDASLAEARRALAQAPEKALDALREMHKHYGDCRTCDRVGQACDEGTDLWFAASDQLKALAAPAPQEREG